MLLTLVRLADARAELGISQATLAAAAKLSRQVIISAEKGLPVQRISAHAILNALNIFRRREGKEPLLLNEVEMRIRGESRPGQ